MIYVTGGQGREVTTREWGLSDSVFQEGIWVGTGMSLVFHLTKTLMNSQKIVSIMQMLLINFTYTHFILNKLVSFLEVSLINDAMAL